MKSLLTLFPALAVALVLTACAPEQPAVPQTPVSVERALEENMQDQNNQVMEADAEVNVELDNSLDLLEEELDAALNKEIELTIDEPVAEPEPEPTPEPATEVEVEAEAQAAAEPTPEPMPEPVNVDNAGEENDPGQEAPVQEEEELIDQPIIIE